MFMAGCGDMVPTPQGLFSSLQHEFKPRPPDGKDQELEKPHVVESVRPSLENFDLVVDAFNHTGVDPEVEPIQDPIRMLLDCGRQFHQQRDTAGPGRFDPFCQGTLGIVLLTLLPDLPNVLFKNVP
jgi:hypothetical protein